MKLDEVFQLQLLKRKAIVAARHPRLLDELVELPDAPLKQMCAKVSPQLFDAMKNASDMLDMSQREFIEAAVAEAVNKAHSMADSMGVFEQGEL